MKNSLISKVALTVCLLAGMNAQGLTVNLLYKNINVRNKGLATGGLLLASSNLPTDIKANAKNVATSLLASNLSTANKAFVKKCARCAAGVAIFLAGMELKRSDYFFSIQ